MEKHMSSREMPREYEMMLKILSMMVYGKPVALVAISQKTGIKLADIIRYMKRLEAEKIIRRSMDNGNTFYILDTEDYEEQLDALYPPPIEQPAKTAISSREAILKRRSAARNAQSADSTQALNLSADRLSPATPIPTEPKRISAVDLMAIRKSSATNKRIYDPARTMAHNPMLSSSSELRKVEPDSPKVTSLSSPVHKAVYINRPTPRNAPPSRSMFTALPPAGMDALGLERSDGELKFRENYEKVNRQPLIPFHAATQISNEVSDDEVRQKLNLAPDDKLYTILSPRPTHELWSACSALANSGGGTLVLGLKKYVQDQNITYFVKSIARPEDAMKVILRNFNDRSVISDCPKDPNFIKTINFGKKTVIALQIDPAQLSNAPLFTTRDSFNMHTTKGCYIYRNGEIIHCSEDEIKMLWQAKRLGCELPDWEQTGEQVPVQMDHKIKISLPAVLDDSLRPLSRKENTYGQPIVQPYHRRRTVGPSDQLTGYMPTSPAEKISSSEPDETDVSYPHSDAHSQNFNIGIADPNKQELAALLSDGGFTRTMRNTVDDPQANDNSSRQFLLFAEDICTSQPQINAQESQTAQADAPLNQAEDIPPCFADADHALLESIALPAVEHPRLPTLRLCEIAVNLCKVARLKPLEIAELLHKKLVPVRDKILPSIKEHPNVHCVDGAYYIKP